MKYPMPQNGFGRPACIIVQFIKVRWALAGTSFNELDSCDRTHGLRRPGRVIMQPVTALSEKSEKQ